MFLFPGVFGASLGVQGETCQHGEWATRTAARSGEHKNFLQSSSGHGHLLRSGRSNLFIAGGLERTGCDLLLHHHSYDCRQGPLPLLGVLSGPSCLVKEDYLRD